MPSELVPNQKLCLSLVLLDFFPQHRGILKIVQVDIKL